MDKKMKITGVAPMIAIPTFLYLTAAVIINYMSNGIFTITQRNYFVLETVGIILIVTGALMVINCSIKLQKSFRKDKLMTDGLYKIFRNPMYAAYMLFVIPGICLFFNSWLVLTAVVVNWLLTFIFIKREYRYLQEKFGREYEEYLNKVLIKFL